MGREVLEGDYIQRVGSQLVFQRTPQAFRIGSRWRFSSLAKFFQCLGKCTDLFEFANNDGRYVFEVASAEPVPASIDKEQAAQRTLEWASRFYGARDLDIVDIAFKIKPARFWLVTFRGPGADAPLFGVWESALRRNIIGT
jgi:hypothetical protein